MDYDKWLQRFTGSVERIVYRLTLAFVVILFLAQAVLLNDHLRPYLNYTDRFEGRALLEDLLRFIMRDEFRRIEVMEPSTLVLNSRDVEKLLFRINEIMRKKIIPGKG